MFITVLLKGSIDFSAINAYLYSPVYGGFSVLDPVNGEFDDCRHDDIDKVHDVLEHGSYQCSCTYSFLKFAFVKKPYEIKISKYDGKETLEIITSSYTSNIFAEVAKGYREKTPIEQLSAIAQRSIQRGCIIHTPYQRLITGIPIGGGAIVTSGLSFLDWERFMTLKQVQNLLACYDAAHVKRPPIIRNDDGDYGVLCPRFLEVKRQLTEEEKQRHTIEQEIEIPEEIRNNINVIDKFSTE